MRTEKMSHFFLFFSRTYIFMPTVTGVFYCTCSLSSSSLGKHYKCRKKQRWRRAAQITPTESLSTSRASIMAAVARGRGSGWWASSKKQNKNKLHNIYIPPSLVTYFTQKPWELIIRPCCQLSLIDFPSRFLLFFFSLQNDINYITQA